MRNEVVFTFGCSARTPLVELYGLMKGFNVSLITLNLYGTNWIDVRCDVHDDGIKWKHFSRHWHFVGKFTGHRWIPLTNASDAELWCFLWSASEQTVNQTIETPAFWDAVALVLFLRAGINIHNLFTQEFPVKPNHDLESLCFMVHGVSCIAT